MENGKRQRHARGYALATVLWWVAAVCGLLVASSIWTQHRGRWEAKVYEATDHAYLAEGILANEINRLKSKPWGERWYRSLPGIITGRFGRAEYTGYIQDVADFWSGQTSRTLADHTDIFLKIRHPADEKNAPSRSFFHRLVFREATLLRPTRVLPRRLSAVADLDPGSAGDRARVIAWINDEERERERNRPLSNVLVRRIGAEARLGRSLERIARDLGIGPPRLAMSTGWSLMAGPAFAGIDTDERTREASRPLASVIGRETLGLERGGTRGPDLPAALVGRSGQIASDIALERRLLSLLKGAQRILIDPVMGASRPDLDRARQFTEQALAIARQQDAANREGSVPMCLYAAGRAARQLGLTHPVSTSARNQALDAAIGHFQEIVQRYPWTPAALAEPGYPSCSGVRGEFPWRHEAPHAYVALAFLGVEKESRANVAAYNAAVDRGLDWLERLRECYPYFHLWGEDAVTGFNDHPRPALTDDETVWFLEQLLKPVWFSMNRIGSSFSSSFAITAERVFKLTPESAGHMQAPLPSPDRTKVAAYHELCCPWTGYDGIWVVNIDGSGLRQVATQAALGLASGAWPGGFDWLPDGSGFVYIDQNDRNRLKAIDLNGTNQRTLDTLPFPLNGRPRVSPTGRLVAFERRYISPCYDGSIGPLYFMDMSQNPTTGAWSVSNLRPIRPSTGQPPWPCYSNGPQYWLPDGSGLAISSEGPGYMGTILVDLAGNELWRTPGKYPTGYGLHSEDGVSFYGCSAETSSGDLTAYRKFAFSTGAVTPVKLPPLRQ